MNTRQRGKEWEQKVCRYLKDKGYFIVDVNFACACGCLLYTSNGAQPTEVVGKLFKMAGIEK